MAEITIKGEKFSPKYCLRALFIYERMSGKSGFTTETSEDTFMFFYAMLKASKKDTTLTWDEFIDECEANPAIVTQISECVTAQVKANEAMSGPAENDGAKKK